MDKILWYDAAVSVLVLNLLGLGIGLLSLGLVVWQIRYADKKHEQEMDSLKQKIAGCVSAWIYLLYSVGLFLLLALVASSSRPRKTA